MCKLCVIMSVGVLMNSEVETLLKNRFVLFSCERTAEGVVIQVLYGNDLLVVPGERVVKDEALVKRPYTRTRSAAKIAEQYFSMDYGVDGAEGLTVARIIDSRSAKFEFPKRKQNGTKVLSFVTRPEIEMLVIHNEGAFSQWQSSSRKDRQLRPSDFCVRELHMADIKEKQFLERYWSDPGKLVTAIEKHARKTKRNPGELLLVDLLKN